MNHKWWTHIYLHVQSKHWSVKFHLSLSMTKDQNDKIASHQDLRRTHSGLRSLNKVFILFYVTENGLLLIQNGHKKCVVCMQTEQKC